MRNAARELSDSLHLLRLMQLLLETTSFRHVVGADDNPAPRAGLLRRWHNNGLDDGGALSSCVSVWRSLTQARSKMGLDFRRALGAEGFLDRAANHSVAGLFIQSQSCRIDLGIPKMSAILLNNDRVTFRGVIEERLDERLRSRQLPGAIFDSLFQGFVELGQGPFGLLGGRDVVGDADEADVFARRAPSGRRFRS